jgi:uncharacterized membrane protein
MTRQREVSRLEGFSDAVFGFALTLLVVSLETPMTVHELRNQAGSFLPFVLMFAMISWIWYQHNQFFRRYGLQDAWTVFLNSALLFVVLFYVYPLKFLTLALVGWITMTPDVLPAIQEIGHPLVMVIYSAGVFLIFGIFALLHVHARVRRQRLELTERELLELRYSLRGHLISAGLAVASLLLIWLLPAGHLEWAGIIYGLMGPLHGLNGYMGGRAKSALSAPAAIASIPTHEEPTTEPHPDA